MKKDGISGPPLGPNTKSEPPDTLIGINEGKTSMASEDKRNTGLSAAGVVVAILVFLFWRNYSSVNRYNREVDQVNQRNAVEADRYNREVDRHNRGV
jgi:hypothetical protein